MSPPLGTSSAASPRWVGPLRGWWFLTSTSTAKDSLTDAHTGGRCGRSRAPQAGLGRSPQPHFTWDVTARPSGPTSRVAGSPASGSVASRTRSSRSRRTAPSGSRMTRTCGLEQRRPARPGLFARVAATAPPGRTRGRRGRPVRRRRLRGVPRVAAQTPFELRDPRVLGCDPRGELLDHPGLLFDQREELLPRDRLGPGHRT